MFTQTVRDPIARRLRGPAISLFLHLTALLSPVLKEWILVVFSIFFAWRSTEPPRTLSRVTLLAPPPGQPAPHADPRRLSRGQQNAMSGLMPIPDTANITWGQDNERHLIPVMRSQSGLIVFVDPLDHMHPRMAFRPDGSRVQAPSTLEHYVRVRVDNPSWWPDIQKLCATVDPQNQLDVIAAFPPEYREKLGEVVRARMNELKMAGPVVGLDLVLDERHAGGVIVRDVKVQPLESDGHDAAVTAKKPA